jgi:pilus assembly protein CpaE
MYEYVVVDTPPSFTEQVLVTMDRSDLTLLLATPEVPSIKNLKLTIDMTRMLGMADEARAVVLNRADSDTGISSADVEHAVGVPIVAHVPASRAVPAAVNRGKVLTIDEPKHAVSVAVRRLVESHITAHEAASAVPRAERSAARSGLLRRRREVPA